MIFKFDLSAITFRILALCILTIACQSVRAEQTRQSVGLVLSGGGAKGIAHIGVIQALEENDIPIDYIAGTSMGAIVGGLYAAGYTPDEMMQLILSREFAHWSTGRIDPNLTYYFNKQQSTPAFFTKELSRKPESGDTIAASLISGFPMSFAFMELFSAHTAVCGGDFDKLFVPFRCVASDVDARQKHVFRNGNLGNAIRASMSFPIVFQPITIDGKLLYDGGIYDNFPVSVMREDFSPSIMLGINVSTVETGPQTSLMDQIDKLVIQNNDYSLPDNEGIKLNIDLKKFYLLDFEQADEIYRIGYDNAMAMMDSIKSRISPRIPLDLRNSRRQEFKSRLPILQFDRVEVSGGTKSQNDYITHLFGSTSKTDTIDIDHARDVYYRAISSDRFRELLPQTTYNDSTDLFTLNLKASIKGGFNGSIGGYISSSTNSFIYASAGYSTLSFSRISANIEAWIGSTHMASAVNGRIHLQTLIPSAITATAVISREKLYKNDHIFFDDKLPSSIVSNEYFGRTAWSLAAGHHGAIDIGVGYGKIKHTYDLIESDGNDDLCSTENLGQVYIKYSRSTLDSPNFPITGRSLTATTMGMLGNSSTDNPNTSLQAIHTSPKWLQFEFASRHYPELSKRFTLGIETDIMLSTRKLLPTYSATIASAPNFCPTPASDNIFRSEFRANSFITLGIIPVYKFSSSISARIGGYTFTPLRKIIQTADNMAVHGRWLKDHEFFGEANLSYHFPFGTLTGYANYSSTQSNKWNVGISFGIHILPPNFLR